MWCHHGPSAGERGGGGGGGGLVTDPTGLVCSVCYSRGRRCLVYRRTAAWFLPFGRQDKNLFAITNKSLYIFAFAGFLISMKKNSRNSRLRRTRLKELPHGMRCFILPEELNRRNERPPRRNEDGEGRGFRLLSPIVSRMCVWCWMYEVTCSFLG